MDRLRLSEREITYYFDTFDAYDVGNKGKVLLDEAYQLFHQSGLAVDVLDRIVALCGATRSGYFGRIQFFTALKLIALAQSGREVSLDSVYAHGPLALPVFSRVHTRSNYNEGQPNTLSASSCFTGLDSDALASAVDQTSTLSEISTHFSTVSQEAVPSLFTSDVAVDNFSDSCANHFSVNTGDNRYWMPFEEEECGLLTNERVDRRKPYLSNSYANYDAQYTSSQFSSHRLTEYRDISPSSSNMSDPEETANTVYSISPLPNRYEFDNIVQSIPGDSAWSYQHLNENSENIGSSFHSVNQRRRSTSSSSDDDSPEDSDRQYRSFSTEFPSSGKMQHIPGRNSATRVNTGTKQEHHQKWLALFTLHPKKEAEYASQFENMFPPSQTELNDPLLTFVDIEQLFIAQFGISSEELQQIWRLADLDRDGFLNKAEFCLACHLAHLHGDKGLSIEDAVSATASYIAKRVPALQHPVAQAESESEFPLPLSSLEYPLSQNGDNRSGESSRPVRVAGDTASGTIGIVTESPDEHSETALLADPDEHNNATDRPSPCRMDNHGSADSESDMGSFESTTNSALSSSSRTSSDRNSGSSDTDSNNEPNGSSPVRSVSGVLNEKRKGKHRRIDSIQLLAIATGRRPSKLAHYSGAHRRRLLTYLIREAKAVNHTLLRLNNEMEGEWTELKDQRVNLSAQLQHLGLQPP
ncbi:EF hand [Paragonimus heterotremus]|uniref:EF hand n=1 Tax=Paragonimus heterotremus TaxID=100268 RepID=A0A8J4T6M7_9TREM|nr:EF hand [Paragonimus heterotremus]